MKLANQLRFVFYCAILLLLATSLWGDEEFYSPIIPFPSGDLPSDWTPVDGLLYPASIGSEITLPSSPAPTVTFKALTDPFTYFPPNAFGAVGSNYVVTMNNTDVRIQDRVGNTNSSVTTDSWWSSLGASLHVSEQRVIFDQYADRWMASAHATNTTGAGAWVLWAVSASNDPTGTWYKGKFEVDSTHVVWADYTRLGFNKNWIVASYNLFSGSTFQKTRLYMFNRTNIYAGGTNCVVQDVRTVTNDPTIANLQPTTTYDISQSTLYLFESAPYDLARGLVGFTITGSPDSPSFNYIYREPTSSIFASVPPVNNFGPQAGGTNKVYLFDARIESLCYRDNSLWAAQTVFLPYNAPTHSAILWWEISASTMQAIQTGLIEVSTNCYAFPSIAVNKFHDVLIGYSSFTSNSYPSAVYSFRAANDPPGKTRPLYTFKAGEGYYWRAQSSTADNRWGDYGATMTDPLNDTDFWTIQEYATTNSSSGNLWTRGRWALQWAKVSVPVADNDMFTNAYQLTGLSGSTNGTAFRATRESNAETNYLGTNTIGHSVWYQWTAPTNGLAQFYTSNSTNDLDTVIAVCTGTNVNSLTLVTSNDDFRGGVKNFKGLSALSFNATAGTTYRIVVDTKTSTIDGFDQFVLTWLQPTDPVFAESPLPETHILVGDTLTLTSLAGSIPAPTYQWFKETNSITSATNSSLIISNVQTSDAATYHVQASNGIHFTNSLSGQVFVYASATATVTNWSFGTNILFLHVKGFTNHLYDVQSTTNFLTWSTVNSSTASFDFRYTNSVPTNDPIRFFRATYHP